MADVAPPKNVGKHGRWTSSRAVRRFVRHRLALTGLVMIAVIAALCIAGPWLLPHGMLDIHIIDRFSPPGTGTYILGTDGQGRDILSRLLYGTRRTLLIGLLSGGIGGFLDRVAGTAQAAETGE